MLITGVVEKNGWIIALLLGIGNFLAAAWLLWAFQRSFLVDSQRSVRVNHHPHIVFHERIVTCIISGFLVVTGFYSAPWHALIDTATGTIGKYFDFRHAIYNDDPANIPDGQNNRKRTFIE